MTDFSADVGLWPSVKALMPVAGQPDGLRRLLQRTANEIPPERIISLSAIALDPRLRRRRDEPVTDFWARRNAAFCRAVVKVGLGDAAAVYAFNGAALEIFRAAKADGRRTILDQTAAPWRWNSAMLADEAARWPGWETDPSEIDESGLLTAREEAEWALADAIVVGSHFARSALAEGGGPAHRAVTLPYPLGADGEAAVRRYPNRLDTHRKLRVLFLGTLQLRKGVQYLDEAARSLRRAPIEFRLVGPSRLSDRAERQLAEVFDMPGAASRRDVPAHLAWADLLVLPTLSEGSANVCYEAVAAGVPVITTPNAGVPIEEMGAGWVVPPQSAGALANALHRILVNPDRLHDVAAALRTARRTPSFEEYARQLSQLISSGLPQPTSAERACA